MYQDLAVAPAMSIAEAHQKMAATPGSMLEVEEREIRGVLTRLLRGILGGVRGIRVRAWRR